jgi:hypothetical protein
LERSEGTEAINQKLGFIHGSANQRQWSDFKATALKAIEIKIDLVGEGIEWSVDRGDDDCHATEATEARCY